MPKETNRESISGFVNSFKLFEQKLDKVQEDVVHQGRILSDLKVMVRRLSEQIQVSRIDTQDSSLKRKIKAKSFQGKKLPKKPDLKKGSNNLASKSSNQNPVHRMIRVHKRSIDMKKKLEKGDHNRHV